MTYEESEIDAIGREMLRQALLRGRSATLTQGPFMAEQDELRKVKKELEDILGHLRKLVYENGSKKIDMRTEVINILAEYE